MNQAALIEQLNNLLAAEMLGLNKHLQEAVPHLTNKTFLAYQKLTEISQTSLNHASCLTQLVTSLGDEVRAPNFHASVTDFHFIDFVTLLPKLASEQQAIADGYSKAIELASGDQSICQKLETLKQQTLENYHAIVAFVESN